MTLRSCCTRRRSQCARRLRGPPQISRLKCAIGLLVGVFAVVAVYRAVVPPGTAADSCDKRCIVDGRGCLHVIISFFRPSDPLRLKELVDTFQRNLANPYIASVHVLREESVPFELLLHSAHPVHHNKAVDGGLLNGKPTYKDLFEYGNGLVNSGHVTNTSSLVISHADIEFSDVPKLDVLLASRLPSVVWAISRKSSPRCTQQLQGCISGGQWYEECPELRSEQCEDYGGSHDVFMYSGVVSQSLLSTTHFAPNSWGAENLLIYLLRTCEGKIVENPCNYVHAYHVHCNRTAPAVSGDIAPDSVRVNDALRDGTRASLSLSVPQDFHMPSCNLGVWTGPPWKRDAWSAVRWASDHGKLLELPWEIPNYDISSQWNSIRNSESNGRCLLVANGPSLNRLDWNLLHQSTDFDVVLGMNKIFLGMNRFNMSLTDFVAVNNLVIEQSVRQIIALGPLVRKFLPYNSQKYFPDSVVNNSAYHNIWWLGRPSDPWYSTQGVCRSQFCFDVSRGANQGYTVTYVALQVLHFLGCESVSIVGMDHSFAQSGKGGDTQVLNGADPNHFDDNYFGGGQQWQLADLEQSEHYYAIARQAYDVTGRQLVDATINGKCHVFDKADYAAFFICMFGPGQSQHTHKCDHLVTRAQRDGTVSISL